MQSNYNKLSSLKYLPKWKFKEIAGQIFRGTASWDIIDEEISSEDYKFVLTKLRRKD